MNTENINDVALLSTLCEVGEISLVSLEERFLSTKNVLLLHLRHWQAQGIPLHFDQNDEKIYFDSKLPLLDGKKILPFLPNTRLIYQPVIGSTNDFLLTHQNLPSGTLCMAEFQTHGRGRRGRQWLSPFAGQFIFSVLWQFSKRLDLTGLSLVVGLAIAKALRQLGADDVQLKWPNDILLQGKKLGGILVELAFPPTSYCNAIIGVGLNWKFEKDMPIDQPYTNLHSVLPEYDRETIFVAIWRQLNAFLEQFTQFGFQPFVEMWHEFDAFAGAMIVLQNKHQQISGIECGIDEKGWLILQNAQTGEREHFCCGEFSLRSWQQE